MSTSDTTRQASSGNYLALASVNAQGKALGLRSGDILLRIDTHAVNGQTKDLLARFKENPDRQRALWMRRDGHIWPILVRTPTIGRWRAMSAPEVSLPESGLTPAARLRNFEVMCGPDESYDAQPQRPSVLALLPPIYLIQMRLWAPLAIWAALTALCVPLGWVAGGALQVLISIYFWRAAPMLVRVDRMARGFRLWRVVAARSERDLHRRMSDLAPELRFLHAQSGPVADRVEAR